MPISEVLQPQHVCVSAERNEFNDEMAEWMADAAGGACIQTDRHETRIDGQVVCSSESHGLADKLWRLDSLETNAAMRSRGIGAAHVTRLLEMIREEEPTAVALFFEIRSRKEAGLSAAEREVRERRGRFYERLGAVAWAGVALVPCSLFGGVPQPGAELAQMELMWIPLKGTPTARDIEVALRFLLLDVGNLDYEHPLLGQVLSQQFPDGIPQHVSPRGSVFDSNPSLSGD